MPPSPRLPVSCVADAEEPGTQLSWGDGDGPEILAFDWSVFVLMLGCVGRHGAKPSWRKHGGWEAAEDGSTGGPFGGHHSLGKTFSQ